MEDITDGSQSMKLYFSAVVFIDVSNDGWNRLIKGVCLHLVLHLPLMTNCGNGNEVFAHVANFTMIEVYETELCKRVYIHISIFRDSTQSRMHLALGWTLN